MIINICPILTGTGENSRDCMEEGCAWYIENENGVFECAISILGREAVNRLIDKEQE